MILGKIPSDELGSAYQDSRACQSCMTVLARKAVSPSETVCHLLAMCKPIPASSAAIASV